MKNDRLLIDSVDRYNKIYGQETLHPLVTVFDITDSPSFMNGLELQYGLYALFLKRGEGCTIRYGREKYDYQEGTIVTFAPGQTVSVYWDEALPMPPSRALLFSPDLLYGTPLGRKIKDYTFFDYSQREALHLSERERNMFDALLSQIAHELSHPVDRHSQTLITDAIGLLLDYCMRYYDRQFITRHKVCNNIATNFLRSLNDYFATDKAETLGLPTVAHFADKACLSTGYFGDLIKKETGIAAQTHIRNAIIEQSKQLIMEDDATISAIAYQLGFQYPQHFTRLFKSTTGMSPAQFRKQHLAQ